MGNCVSRRFGFRNRFEETEEITSNTKMAAKCLELSDNNCCGVTATRDNSNNEAAEVFPRYNRCGVWEVNLVISSEKLSHILSEDGRTEALIERVRAVAKYAAAAGEASPVIAADSDHWMEFNYSRYN